MTQPLKRTFGMDVKGKFLLQFLTKAS